MEEITALYLIVERTGLPNIEKAMGKNYTVVKESDGKGTLTNLPISHRLQQTVHEVNIDVAENWMREGFRQTADDFKTEALP